MLGHGTAAQRLGEHTVEPAGAVSHGTHCKGKAGVRDGPQHLITWVPCAVPPAPESVPESETKSDGCRDR